MNLDKALKTLRTGNGDLRAILAKLVEHVQELDIRINQLEAAVEEYADEQSSRK